MTVVYTIMALALLGGFVSALLAYGWLMFRALLIAAKVAVLLASPRVQR